MKYLKGKRGQLRDPENNGTVNFNEVKKEIRRKKHVKFIGYMKRVRVIGKFKMLNAHGNKG